MSGENGSGGVNPDHRARIETRVEELRRELATGKQRLHNLEAEATLVRETLLRIEGALLAYDEVLGNDEALADSLSPAAPATG